MRKRHYFNYNYNLGKPQIATVRHVRKRHYFNYNYNLRKKLIATVRETMYRLLGQSVKLFAYNYIYIS